MTTKFIPALMATLLIGAAGHALADTQPAGKTREQVKAELAEAVRTGNIVVGERSETLKELYPNLYPADTAKR